MHILYPKQSVKSSRWSLCFRPPAHKRKPSVSVPSVPNVPIRDAKALQFYSGWNFPTAKLFPSLRASWIGSGGKGASARRARQTDSSSVKRWVVAAVLFEPGRHKKGSGYHKIGGFSSVSSLRLQQKLPSAEGGEWYTMNHQYRISSWWYGRISCWASAKPYG